MNDRTFAPITTEWDDTAVEKLVDEAIESKRTSIKRSYMQIGPYNGFAREVRLAADRKIKIAIELGLVPKPCKCSICGKTEGRIDYHGENYGRPLQVAPICVGCHMALHLRHSSPGRAAGWAKRVAQYGDGSKWFEQLDSGS